MSTDQWFREQSEVYPSYRPNESQGPQSCTGDSPKAMRVPTSDFQLNIEASEELVALWRLADDGCPNLGNVMELDAVVPGDDEPISERGITSLPAGQMEAIMRPCDWIPDVNKFVYWWGWK